MKKAVILTLIALWGSIQAAPQGKPDEPIPIVRQESNIEADGAYSYSYETGNGIKGEEAGTVQKSNDPEGSDFVVARGSYSYTAPDGTVITVTYEANDQGFIPQGAHLPTPPPIPPEIQKALEFIASVSQNKPK